MQSARGMRWVLTGVTVVALWVALLGGAQAASVEIWPSERRANNTLYCCSRKASTKCVRTAFLPSTPCSRSRWLITQSEWRSLVE